MYNSFQIIGLGTLKTLRISFGHKRYDLYHLCLLSDLDMEDFELVLKIKDKDVL